MCKLVLKTSTYYRVVDDLVSVDIIKEAQCVDIKLLYNVHIQVF